MLSPAPREFKYLERVSESRFHTTYRIKEGAVEEYVFTAQQIRLFIAYDLELRKSKSEINWWPAGYNHFASAFNKEKFVEKLAYFSEDDGANPNDIINLDKEPPSINLFGVEPYACFAPGRCVRPGYVEIPESRYQDLERSAALQAQLATKGRLRAEERKLQKKLSTAADQHKSSLHFAGSSRNRR
ncbi:hypothetical protein D9757_013033 [Collybiopsis confluens]|uniref:Uncharacterized protein n=1 Tax=Collybiopsis confluens TaxID=2823264 RepID=A0A8H5LIR5_9AGAR|nr:hypothetical protein D9757_013033 [Collybiopsis confluens]